MYAAVATVFPPLSEMATICPMAKSESEKVGRPISVRFKPETLQKLSRIRMALVCAAGGVNLPLSGLITVAVEEYIRNHAHLIEPKGKKR